ncbi:MAG: cation diffusion facilitator family transporter [Candidatus Firestonebacteria bacterium]
MEYNIDANKKKVYAAKFSIISNTILLVLKLLTGVITTSVSIIAEAIHSGIDLIASVITNYSVKTSIKPADEKHKFGHGKVENISALIEGMLIFFASYLILHEAYDRIIHKIQLKTLGIGIGIMFVSTISNFFISKYLFKVAKEADSAALEADAWHLRTDVYTSFGVFMGLIFMNFVKIKGIEIFDPIIAIITAVLIIKAGWDISKEAIINLTDIKLPGEEEKLIKMAIEENPEKFIEFHNLRTRKAGAYKYIDLHLVVSKDLHIDKAHKLMHHLSADIKNKLKNTDIMFHLEPCNSKCEGCRLKCSKQK